MEAPSTQLPPLTYAYAHACHTNFCHSFAARLCAACARDPSCPGDLKHLWTSAEVRSFLSAVHTKLELVGSEHCAGS